MDILPKISNTALSALSGIGQSNEGARLNALPNYTISRSFTSEDILNSLSNYSPFAGDAEVNVPKEYSETDLDEARRYVAAKLGFSRDEVNSWPDEMLIERTHDLISSTLKSGDGVPDILMSFEEVYDIQPASNTESSANIEIQSNEGDLVEEYESKINELNRDLIKDVEEHATYTKPWDPRIWRIDGYVTASEHNNSGNNSERNFVAVVPFSTESACSAFKDRKFLLSSDKYNQIKNAVEGTGVVADANDISPQIELKDGNENNSTIITYIGANPDDSANNYELRDKNYYGLSSLMNPYSITLLAGGLAVNPTISEAGNKASFNSAAHPNLYVDIRDQRRFYDLSVVTSNSEDDIKDVLSVSAPTTTNIIKFSSRDHWGRTPYSFQDFVFCKWWNIIPNNRLITLRKYSTPCLDNLQFQDMYDANGQLNINDPNATFAPIATVVTYFGEETGNTLKSLLKFSTGPKWVELESKIHEVTGNAGTNSMEVMDQMIHGRNMGTNWNLVDSFFNRGLYAAGDKYVALSKLFNLATNPHGYDASIANWQKLTSAQMDPYANGPLANKIQGPVNAIMNVYKRDQGINFSQDSLNIKCSYVSKEIGGINPKAAMLDILTNCLMMGSVNAMFWGGGYRFDISRNGYAWGLGKYGKSFLEKMAKGEIFGAEGAIATSVRGVKDSLTDSTGEFSFSTVTSKLGSVVSNAINGLGNVIEGAVNNLFGTSFSRFQNRNAESAGNTTKGIFDNLKSNVTNFFKNEITQQTMYPQINGMRALLTGEPVGNWHLMIGNPLNPIAVIGNLICEGVDIEFSDELGPDDFPVEMTAEFKLKHGMPRDSQAIQSMFNRGNGKIYDLPDYISASSDYETHVDKFTGGTSFNVPEYISPTLYGAPQGKSYKLAAPTTLATQGNPNTSIITKFIPYYKNSVASSYAEAEKIMHSSPYQLEMIANYPVYMGHSLARKALL